MSAAESVISGVVRGVLPYAVIGGAAFLGYTYLRRKGILKDITTTVDNVFQMPRTIVKKIVEIPDSIPNPEPFQPDNTTKWEDDNKTIPTYVIERDEPTLLDKGQEVFNDTAGVLIDHQVAAVEAAKSGDWIKAVQEQAQTNPIIAAGTKIFGMFS